MPTYIRVLVGAPFETDICIPWNVPPLSAYREHTQGNSPSLPLFYRIPLTLQPEWKTTLLGRITFIGPLVDVSRVTNCTNHVKLFAGHRTIMFFTRRSVLKLNSFNELFLKNTVVLQYCNNISFMFHVTIRLEFRSLCNFIASLKFAV